MSQGTACKCSRTNFVVDVRNANYSAFSGYRRTYSAYSAWNGELNEAFGLSPEEARAFHWDWADRKGNVNALNYKENLELAELATEEAMANGTFYTICQSCCWPILTAQKKVWHSMAAEGHICNDCAGKVA